MHDLMQVVVVLSSVGVGLLVAAIILALLAGMLR